MPIAVLLLGIVAASQTITGSVTGTVTDSQGGVVPGASVTISGEQIGDTRNLVTNEDGRFNFAAMRPGIYTLRVEMKGFQTLLQERVILSANENLAVGELKLQPGQVTETVTVASANAVVETESADLTARLTSDQIELISTKGRDVTSLLRLLPGTSNNDDIEAVGEGFGTDLPNISGQRGRSTVATVDGLNASEPSGSNKISMTINQDAVGEVKVLRNNYGAEYGNNGGAIINIVSKGGGKLYKGTAYYFLRNEALNANQFFNNKGGLKRPLYRHNIPGFNFGGPMPLPRFGEGGPSLLKDRAFFFVSVEKPHTITPTNPVFVTVPTALERQGNFSQSRGSNNQLISVIDPNTGQQFPGNIIPSSRWNSSGAALLNFFPLPNASGTTAGGRVFNYVNQKSVDVPKHSYVIRFDVKPSDRDTVYWKGQWWTSDNEGLGTSGWPGNDENRWGISSHYLYKDNGWSASWVHVFTPNIVNEFTFGMRHGSEGFIPSDGVIERLQRSALNYSAPQLFPENNRLGTIPRVTDWGGVVGEPANINWLDRWGEIGNDYIKPTFSSNLTWNRGRHVLKFGGYFERVLNGEAPGGNWSGSFNFSNGTGNGFTVSSINAQGQLVRGTGNTNYAYANALLGNFNSYSESSSRPFTNLELRLFQWYAQDQWKAHERLSVNYGMRWGYHSPFFQRDNLASTFDPSRYNPANAPLLYRPFCAGLPAGNRGIPNLGTACSAANQRAIDPRVLATLNGTNQPTASQLLSRFLVRSFVPNTGSLTNGLLLASDPDAPKGLKETAPIDWEPRVGFAWDIFGNQKTVLRMHGGIYHAPRTGGGTTGGNLVNNVPFQRGFTINNGNINDLENLIGNATNFPSGLNAVEVSSHTPLTYNYSVGVQQDIGFQTVLEVSYVGNTSRHLGERRNINAVADGTRFTNCPVVTRYGGTCRPENRDPFSATGALNNDFLRPYQGYGDINTVMWSGTANYNSLQVQASRRYNRNFQYGLAYTWSRALDYANDDSSDVNLGRPYKEFNYGVADFDQTHIFTINYIWDVPIFRHSRNGFVRSVLGGWQISGTTSYASGKPITPTATYSGTAVNISPGQQCPAGTTAGAVNAQGFVPCNVDITDFTGGQINARPLVICDPMKGEFGSDSTGTPYALNRGCFAPPTRLGEIGNLPRNSIRRPSTFNSDLAFFKNFRIGERRTLQLRWEIYNIFNHANFTNIDNTMVFGLVQVRTNPDTTVPCSSSLAPSANICTTEFRQTDAIFGAVTSARFPRVMQASIRFNF
jgi:hypothetical protein